MKIIKRSIFIFLLLTIIAGMLTSCSIGDFGIQGEQGIQGEPGEDGKDGKDGEDGKNGADGITPLFRLDGEELYVSYDEGKTWENLGKVSGTDGKDGVDGEDGVNGKDGVDGEDGVNGLSAFEIFKKYYPEYTGTEEEWIYAVATNNLCALFGHNIVIDEAVTPTCTSSGLTEGSHCDVCKKVFVEQKNIDASHDYVNDICSKCGHSRETAIELTMQYDDHYNVANKSIEIINENEQSNIKLEGDYLVAIGIGDSKVRIDGQLYKVTVEKAKINLIVIMGQSNAGNHFSNATSDVTCPIGTAYWWGNGKGTSATEPVDYTQPSMGFHTPLLAELYAQSKAAGKPIKNVLIWEEGITSKNGQSIVKWAYSATDTSGTDATVTMIKNCYDYYEANGDKYEIVSSGVYWLQGESDTTMDPTLYTQRFMAMWERLEAAGMDYLAFLRLRWGTTANGEDHQDLYYSASLSAQIKMINENPNFYMATDLTENWVGTANTVHTIDITNYITVMEAYGKNPTYNDSYGNEASFADGKLTTTMKSLYGSNNKCHYGKFGYGLIGADAAYNMYNALNSSKSTIVVTDTSGHANRKSLLNDGERITIDITDMLDDISLRTACGSEAGTLHFVVRSGENDITHNEGVIIATGQKYGAIDTSKLRDYDNVTIEIIYNTVKGEKCTVICDIVNNKEASKDYIWDFNEDIYARDKDGNILNSFLTTPIEGSYTIENGYLTGNDLMLQLEHIIELESDKNWFVEWKYGAFVNGAAGFLLCEEPTNVIGNKAFYHTLTGKMLISNYLDKKGYYNYTSSDVIIEEYDCIRISNFYDLGSGRSILSLWKNGELVIEDFQMKGNINAASDNLDMTDFPLDGNFSFGYLGHNNMESWGMNCELDYLYISFGEQSE